MSRLSTMMKDLAPPAMTLEEQTRPELDNDGDVA